MPKRKHDEISSSSNPQARALRLQRLQLSSLLEQSKTSLFRSLKVARGFERQKLGRRQKTAKTSSDAPDTARLDAEVAALKGLDLASTAEIHLYKSLLKTKSIAAAPAFPYHVQATVDASKKPQETASANVQARLFKSGPVQAAMTEALKGIRAALGVEEKQPNGKKRMRAKDYDNGLSAGIAKESSPPPPRKNERSRSASPSDGDEWDGITTPQSSQEDERNEVNEDDDGVDYNIYTSRLAGSSDSESMAEETESEDHDRDELNAMSITDEEVSEDSSALEDEEEEEDQDQHNPTLPTPNPKSKPPTAPPKTTTFLPSLSVGGYWSGSDTDSASNSPSSSTANPAARRNRMGQQARRALWEKKFGRNANHVKKETRARARAQDRDEGWDARKGARGADDGRGKRGRGRGGGVRRGGGGRFVKSTGANSDPVVARDAKPKPKPANAAEGPLHPSWEAARKAKEQKKAVPFQGKKVVFD